MGYHIWYDEGIDPGTEWDENIASHLSGCVGILAFMSANYLSSENCKDELNYARDLGKDRVLVYLEQVELPAGMAMRLNRIQALHKYKYNKSDDFYTELIKAPLFKENNVAPKENEVAPASDEAIVPNVAKSEERSDITKNDFIKKEECRTAGYCIFGGTIAVCVLAVVMMFVGGIMGGAILIAVTILAQLRLNQWFAVAGVAVALVYSFILPIFIVVLLAALFLMLCLFEVNRLYNHYITEGELLPFMPYKPFRK
jgi:hypothetical protein